MKKIYLILLSVVLVITLTSCVGGATGVNQVSAGDSVQVVWTEINPPPNTDGPCYAYFTKSAAGYAGYGFSGVYCSSGN